MNKMIELPDRRTFSGQRVGQVSGFDYLELAINGHVDVDISVINQFRKSVCNGRHSKRLLIRVTTSDWGWTDEAHLS